jgi:serine/threonine kinase PknH
MWAAPPPGPPGPPPRKGTPWIPIAAAAAVFVLVLGALGIWFLIKPDDSTRSGMATSTTTEPTETTERTTRRTPRSTTTAPAPNSAEAKLMGLLPRSYDDDACQPVYPPATGALATVDCGQASSQGGPANARYSLYADQQALDKAFDESVAANSELLQCPDSGMESPTTWHYTDTPDSVAGRIACGVFNGHQDVAWTKNVDLLLGDAQSANLSDLHGWWLKYG